MTHDDLNIRKKNNTYYGPGTSVTILHILTQSFQQHCEVISIIIPTLQMRNWGNEQLSYPSHKAGNG